MVAVPFARAISRSGSSGYLHHERRCDSFSRSIALPAEIESDQGHHPRRHRRGPPHSPRKPRRERSRSHRRQADLAVSHRRICRGCRTRPRRVQRTGRVPSSGLSAVPTHRSEHHEHDHSPCDQDSHPPRRRNVVGKHARSGGREPRQRTHGSHRPPSQPGTDPRPAEMSFPRSRRAALRRRPLSTTSEHPSYCVSMSSCSSA